MKSIPFLLITFLLGYSAAFAQTKSYSGRIPFEDLRKPVVLKVSPFHFFDNTLQVGAEFFKTKTFKTSVFAAANITYRPGQKISDNGGAVELQVRHYPRGFKADSSGWIRNSASGFYLGFGANIGFNEYIDKEYYFSSFPEKVTVKSQWITPSVVFGYQLIAWEALYLDLFLGGGIRINDVKFTSASNTVSEEDYMTNSNIFSRYYKGILPKAGFTLGVGF
ncbi:MAG TPA: hypothetical protein PKY12_06175 [Catalimonadaceae bacterium]|nr:hypothetical protein [Catalimonadaceae bacterium]